jgi:hypothetical protein
MNQFRTSEGDRPTFEETYPRHEFAPLVAIVLALGGWLAGLRRNRVERAPEARAQTPEAPRPAARAS